MSAAHVSRHGNIVVGRVIIAVACLLVVCVNVLMFKRSVAPPEQLRLLKGLMVISFIWIFTGAWAMCTRRNWGRPLVLTIFYAKTFIYFVLVIIILGAADLTLAGGLKPTFIGMVVYFITSLVLTHSKHVRRLTSRAYE